MPIQNNMSSLAWRSRFGRWSVWKQLSHTFYTKVKNTQGQTFYARANILHKGEHFTQGRTFHTRTNMLHKILSILHKMSSIFTYFHIFVYSSHISVLFHICYVIFYIILHILYVIYIYIYVYIYIICCPSHKLINTPSLLSPLRGMLYGPIWAETQCGRRVAWSLRGTWSSRNRPYKPHVTSLT